MKTQEDLNALKAEVETINKKLAELTKEELEQVTGAEGLPAGYTILACCRCGHRIIWPGTGFRPWMSYAVKCEECDCIEYRWVREVKYS